MKKLFLFLILIGVGLSTGVCQSEIPAVYSIRSESTNSYQLEGPYCQILEDPEGDWTIDQVSRSDFSARFHPNETARTGIDYRIHTYWFRHRLRNELSHAVTLFVTGTFGRCDLFVQDGSVHWIHTSTGHLIPFDRRDGLKLSKQISLTLKAGEEVWVYQRWHDTFRYGKPRSFRPAFIPELTTYRSYVKNLEGGSLARIIFTSIQFGIILLAVLFNLYHFVLLRDREYLYFLLFLLCFGFARCYEAISLILFTGQPVMNAIHYAFNPIFWIGFVLFFLLFIRRFLGTPKVLPNWDRALVASGFLYAVGHLLLTILASWLSYDRFLDAWVLVNVVLFPLPTTILFLMILLLLRKKHPSAKFVFVAFTPFILEWLIANSLQLATEEGVTSLAFITADSMVWLWMVGLFSGALTLQYIDTRKALALKELEKERIQKEKEIERNQLVEAQKVELERQVIERTAELNQSLVHLRATQDQLIQQEKMASLGELTAGIAHEIRNPLNFVNNFSEVSSELITELRQGPLEHLPEEDQPEAMAILDDLTTNIEKIMQHGKRADAIVKGMLHHSRSGEGQKEPTDLNAVTNEYLQLAYHGQRAKDKSFNIEMITHFDSTIESIEVVSQDIGRVLLNLFSNAFYATEQKRKTMGDEYEPRLEVTTKRMNNTVEIYIRDNGIGIPPTIQSKIFQPFFTTKATGEGTGLGLSLSYDILKAHGGELRVETEEGRFTEFTIILPL